MSLKVGIVIVSHNASQAVRITLASLSEAENDTPSKVLLVDNASYEMEREKIHSAFKRHTQDESLPWKYIQQDKNLGFSGGNNVGIKHFLEDPDISHICLLNSDVIITDHWLDRLVETQVDIVSAVTNKAESEQCIPIDYNITIDQCIDEKNEIIHANALDYVKNFARDWHNAWAGNLIEGEVTFFCVLIAKKVFNNLGLLDETFFPGGYEDEDFCLRAREQGYKVYIARNVFIHHWGSASFSQLQREYFNNNSLRNLEYLENKHAIVRQRRPEKPFLSFLLDIKFAALSKSEVNPLLRKRYYALYTTQLSAVLKHFEAEFKNLQKMIVENYQEVPFTLQSKIQQVTALKGLTNTWKQIVSKADCIFVGNFDAPIFNKVVDNLTYLIDGIWLQVDCNFAMHDFLFNSQNGHVESKISISSNSTLLSQILKVFQLFIKGGRFLWHLHGVVFFGGYPYLERQTDGYFQRIQMVDNIFSDRWRIYIESGNLLGVTHWFDRPEPKVLVLRVTGKAYTRIFAQVLAFICILKCRRVYFHSILTMRDKRIGWLLHIPGLTKVIDFHGVVTEEFRLHNDFYNAMFYEHIELLASRKCDLIIVVTKAMENYLRQKYGEKLQGEIVLFPMHPNYPHVEISRSYSNAKPVIVYAGGLQKWQLVHKMIDCINRTNSLFEYRFYCPEPSKVKNMLSESLHESVIVEKKTQNELANIYPSCHYGFILREDNIVNHVACPTKLMEYLAMGIVPIVDTENIGDFKSMGMKFVSLDAVLRNSLPSETERFEMAMFNLTLYECLSKLYKKGVHDIEALVSDKSKIRRENRRSIFIRWLKSLIPLSTRLGRLIRSFWKIIITSVENMSKKKLASRLIIPVNLPVGDILVQVDNFEAGGLENIVLDINDAFIKSGYKVILLVLGTPGIGVERSRERGVTVLVGRPEDKWYRTVIEHIRPKVVLSHYSIYGVEMCYELDIPVIQVIQNAYMWLDKKQLIEFEKSASLTTAFIALSEYAKQYSVHRLSFDENRCFVLPCGIDVVSFDQLNLDQVRQEMRALYGFDENDFVFLSVGAINHQKNHMATVRAFAVEALKTPTIKLVILGPAYEKDLLKEILRFIEKHNLKNQIIYLGSAPNARKYYAMADAFISASFFEGGPLNLLEAIKANLPIITTKVGFAHHFENLQGITIIDPPVDIIKFHGSIWDLSSTVEFEKHLTAAISGVYNSSQKPNLPPKLLQTLDKSHTYKLYVDLIEKIIQGNSIETLKETYSSSWINQLKSLSGKEEYK